MLQAKEGGKDRKMLVVTGTALTKNTPVTVLEKLECAARDSAPRREPTGLAEHIVEGAERTAPEAQAQPSSASSDQG